MNEGINLVAICIADGFGAFLSIIMLGARIWTRDRNKREVKLLRMMLYTTLFSNLADICVFVFDGKKGVLLFLILYIGNVWLYVSNMLLGTLWIMVLIAHISGEGLPSFQRILIIVLDVIGSLVLAVNFFYPVVFSLGKENVYTRGPLFWLYILIEIIVVADSIIFYLCYRKKSKEAKHFPVWQFIIPVSISIVVQSLIYGVSLICPSLSLAVCGVILGMFSENEAEADILRQNEKNARIILEQQKQLEEALSMAQSANKAKTTFLNNMSHDIRTPMNAIIGYSGLALTHIDDKEKVTDYLSKIEKSSDYLLSLINEVLDMSRIESGKMTLDEKPENIKQIILSLRDIVQADVRAKDHELVIDTDDIVDETILCDKLRLNQILLNLLSNSIKYTPEHGKISMKVKEQKDSSLGVATYEFCVSDNGIGMEEEYIKTLFEPFTRVNSSTVSGIQGTGLGMAITKNLIEMMGGKIDVQSNVGEGTIIVAKFEFKVIDEEEQVSTNDSVNDTEETINFKDKKILLVEDNDLNREIATNILEENGFIVECAEDGDIAVEKMKDNLNSIERYDVILMDIQMPRMNGYEATRQIRNIQSNEKHTPIIAMTANAFEEDRKLAYEAGMDDYLAKPININELMKVLAKHINSKQRNQA